MILRFVKIKATSKGCSVMSCRGTKFKNMSYKDKGHTMLVLPSNPKTDYHSPNSGDVKITNLPRVHASVLLSLYSNQHPTDVWIRNKFVMFTLPLFGL